MIDDVGRGVRAGAALLAILALCALKAPAPASSESPAKAAAPSTPREAMRGWPGLSRAAARALIAKYGAPTVFDRDRLVWSENGLWLRSVVHRTAPLRLAGLSEGDVVEQSIAYDVPDEKIAEVRRFDRRVAYDKARRWLSSTAASENLNFLVLNLVDEIVIGKRSADEARSFYQTTVELSEAGKSSAYMYGFVFPLWRRP